MLRWALVVSLMLLVGSNLFWAYRMLDFGITHTYLNDGYESCTQRNKQLSEITLRLGASYKRADFLDLVATASSTETSFEKEGVAWIGRLGFVFVDDRLSQIVPDTSYVSDQQ